jgi:hypothetical protein
MCEHVFKPGFALISIYGRLDGKTPVRGDTINPVGSTLGSVDKCEKCGESRGEIPFFIAKGKSRTGNESW